MPETRFTVCWPDGQVDECYSPSTVVSEFLEPNTSYPLEDFLARCRIALERASLRVEAKFGFRCTSADAQLSEIERKASSFATPANVTCISIT